MSWFSHYYTCFFWHCRALKVNAMKNLKNIPNTLLYAIIVESTSVFLRLVKPLLQWMGARGSVVGW
jgi:hypothetical protein